MSLQLQLSCVLSPHDQPAAVMPCAHCLRRGCRNKLAHSDIFLLPHSWKIHHRLCPAYPTGLQLWFTSLGVNPVVSAAIAATSGDAMSLKLRW